MFFGNFLFEGQGMGSGGQVDNDRYYEVLGVSKTATTVEIRKAFKKLAMKEHPDKGGDAEKFKVIREAHDVLANEEKRRMYDQYGESAVKNGADSGPDIGSDVLNMFFGGGSRKRGPTKGPNEQQAMSFSLEEFAEGVRKQVQITRIVVCQSCNGEGAPADSIQTCTGCRGTGTKTSIMRMGQMITQSQSPCSNCQARGKVILPGKACKNCKGNRTKQEVETIEVHLPCGAPSNYKIVLDGKANETPGQIPGNLIIIAQEKPHPLFVRNGCNLIYNHTLSIKDSLCGHTVIIKDILGETLYLLSERITPDSSIEVIKGHGMPDLNQSFARGDLYIKYSVEFPKSLSSEQRAILNKLLPGPCSLEIPQPPNSILVKSEKISAIPKQNQTSSSSSRHEHHDSHTRSDEDEYRSEGVNCQQA